MTDTLREQIARLIAPSRWRVMDSYLAEVKRKYAGQNAAYDPDAFKDAASLKIADDIMTLLPSLPDGWVVVPLEPTREMLEVCGWSGVDPGKPHPMIAHTTVAERGKPYLLPKAYYRAMLAARPTLLAVLALVWSL